MAKIMINPGAAFWHTIGEKQYYFQCRFNTPRSDLDLEVTEFIVEDQEDNDVSEEFNNKDVMSAYVKWCEDNVDSGLASDHIIID